MHSERPITGRPVWQTGQKSVRISNFRFSDVQFHNVRFSDVIYKNTVNVRNPDVRLRYIYYNMEPNVRNLDESVQISDNI